MSSSRRGQSNSRRSEAANDHEEFLNLLASLSTTRGSARSHSGRHTWRPGLIPPCLEPPHRIQSHFAVPKDTLARVPDLSHPDLSRGQRKYLHSIAQIYSLDDTKRALSNSYYGLLMSEMLKGGGGNDSHKRYTDWIYGNHKRLFETNPKIWRSRRIKGRREDSAERTERTPGSDEAGDRRISGRSSGGRAAVRSSDKSPAAPAKSLSPQATPSAETAQTSKQSVKEEEPEQPRQRLQRARSRGSRSGSGRTRPYDDDANEDSTVRVSEAGTAGSRGRSAGRSRAVSAVKGPGGGSGNYKHRSAIENRNSDDDSEDGGGDGRRPRDLGSIMY